MKGLIAAALIAAAPLIGHAGIVLTGTTFHVETIRGEKYVVGELAFKVYNPPISGEFYMTLQQFRPKMDEWQTQGKPAKKDVANTHVGETFTLRRYEPCGGNLSWRIRLFVAPGVAQDGTATAPETVYYPRKAGKQMDCR